MKVRKGFVSNSSTSSFVCDVCAEVFTGMDAGLDDFDMFECENGHTVCEKHIAPALKDDFDEYISDSNDWDIRYNVPGKFCPLCTLDTIDPNDVLSYVLTTAKVSRESVIREIKSKFDTYEELMTYIKKD